MKMKLHAVHYDTCPPDYFGGHHAPFLQIPVYGGMTLKQIKKSLLSELDEGAIGGSLDWELQESVRLHAAMRAAINRIAPNVKGQREFFTHLRDRQECEDTLYAYFVFVDGNGQFYNIDFLGGENHE